MDYILHNMYIVLQTVEKAADATEHYGEAIKGPQNLLQPAPVR